MPENKYPSSTLHTKKSDTLDRVDRPTNERELARQQFKQSIDDLLNDGVNQLKETTDVHLKMQAEPLKLLGGASAVGTVLGLIIGSQIRRTRRIYVDVNSPTKDQKGLIKAQRTQHAQQSKSRAIFTSLSALAMKTLSEKVLAPKLEEVAQNIRQRTENGEGLSAITASFAEVLPTRATPNDAAQTATPSRPNEQSEPTQAQVKRPKPKSRVQALAKSSDISAAQLKNPNAAYLNADQDED